MTTTDYTTEVLNITKIKEGLYIGDELAATNLDVIIQFKLTHMINAAGAEIINAWETINIKYLTLNWSEKPTQNLFDSKDEIANRIVSFIDDSLNKGEGLLAHSHRGQDRVCIVIIIYWMKKYKWNLNKSLEFIRSKKQDVNIPTYFINQLIWFENRWTQRGESVKAIPWSEENWADPEERLLRNTYVNGLPSNTSVPINEGKSKRHILWADCNSYKKETLAHVNIGKDLFFQKNIQVVTTHKRLKPSKSCVKNRSKSMNDKVLVHGLGNQKPDIAVNQDKMMFTSLSVSTKASTLNGNSTLDQGQVNAFISMQKNGENNIANKYKNYRPVQQEGQSNVQTSNANLNSVYTSNSRVGDQISYWNSNFVSSTASSNVLGNNANNSWNLHNTIKQPQGISSSNSSSNNNNITTNKQQQPASNLSINNRSVNNNNQNDLLMIYNKLYGSNQNPIQNNSEQQTNQPIAVTLQQKTLASPNPQSQSLNNNIPLPYNQKLDRFNLQDPQERMNNFWTSNKSNPLSGNSQYINQTSTQNQSNIAKYSIIRENPSNYQSNKSASPGHIGNAADNNNSTSNEKIIITNKFEQIVNNNINNIFINSEQFGNNQKRSEWENKQGRGLQNAVTPSINSNTNAINITSYTPINASVNLSNKNNFNVLNNNNPNTNTNNYNIQPQDISTSISHLKINQNPSQSWQNTPQNKILKTNDNQRFLSNTGNNSANNAMMNNYLNMTMMSKEAQQSSNLNNKNQLQMRVIDYSSQGVNQTPGHNVNFVSYIKNDNYQNNKNQYLGSSGDAPSNQSYLNNYNPKLANQNKTKPLNNYNPNLNKTNNIPNNNLFNRPNTQQTRAGPVKIKNDVTKKPTTPDQLNQIKYTSNINKYGVIERSGSSKFKNENKSSKWERPSTAPQKEKNTNNSINMSSNLKNHQYNGNGSGPNRRLPSPQIQSNSSLNRTQKINHPERYRAPSPVVKSNSSLGNTQMMKRGYKMC